MINVSVFQAALLLLFTFSVSDVIISETVRNQKAISITQNTQTNTEPIQNILITQICIHRSTFNMTQFITHTYKSMHVHHKYHNIGCKNHKL